jgi:hypothetical protein
MRPPLRLGVLAGLLVGLVVGAARAAPPRARPGPQPVPALDEYRWRRRLLVVFAPAAGAPAESLYLAQRREYARAAAVLAERDVTVLAVGADADAARARTLRRRLGVPAAGFAVVLVGKDGGVKLRRRALLGADEVLATVDAMPMGAVERRRRDARRNARADRTPPGG